MCVQGSFKFGVEAVTLTPRYYSEIQCTEETCTYPPIGSSTVYIIVHDPQHVYNSNNRRRYSENLQEW